MQAGNVKYVEKLIWDMLVHVAVAIIVVAIGSIVSCILGTKSAVKTGPEIEGTYINRYIHMYLMKKRRYSILENLHINME